MRKQLLYLTNNLLTAHWWEGGRMSASQTFSNDEEGWRGFSAWIAECAATPAVLLVDLIEEDFQHDTVPFVRGRARAALLQRKLGQMYREVALRRAIQQGRETDGRRDAEVLFSALTNAEQIDPWLQILIRHRVPLAGVFSAALFAPALLALLGLGKETILLQTVQSGGLRQSYLHGGKLRFSRLTPLDGAGPEAVAAAILDETAKIRQFLASTRQLARDKTLQVAVIVCEAHIDSLSRLLTNNATQVYEVVALKETAFKAGLRSKDSIRHADGLYLALAARAREAPHYPVPDATRFFRLWQAKVALGVLTVVLGAGATLWSGDQLLGAWAAKQETATLVAEAALTGQRHALLMRSMPATVANPHDMKLAVDIESMIARNAPEPKILLAMISRALEAVPEVRLNQLHWQVSLPATEGMEGQQALAPDVPAAAPSALLAGIPTRPLQTVKVEADIRGTHDEYRRVLASIDQFTAALRRNRQLEVQVLRSPLDLRPGKPLQGQAGNSAADTNNAFAMQITFKP